MFAGLLLVGVVLCRHLETPDQLMAAGSASSLEPLLGMEGEEREEEEKEVGGLQLVSGWVPEMGT